MSETPAGTAAPAAATLFRGDSEMAARCRALDWAATPLGAVEGWPASLRTVAATVVAAGFPSIVLWGPELIQIYNDAYAPIIGAKHPEALGRGNRDVWPEVWHINGPIYERVRAGETVTLEDQPYPLARRGADAPPEIVYLTIAYSPALDEAGAVGGVFVTMFDTSAQVAGREAQAEQERLHHALAAERRRLETVFRRAPGFLAVLQGSDLTFTLANEAYHRLVGDRDILGRPVFEALPDARGQGFETLLDGVLATGEPFVGREVPITLARARGGVPEERFLDFVYLPYEEADGTRTGVIAHGTDVTEHVLARREIERLLADSEATGRALGAANARLEEQQAELELTNQQLRDNAVELEVQTEALQDAAAQLEEQAEAAARTAAALAASDARYQALLRSVDEGFCVLEVLLDDAGRPADWRFLEHNAAFARQVPYGEPAGRRIREIAPDIDPFWVDFYGRVAETGEPARVTQEAVALGRTYDVFAYRVDDPALRRVAALFTDVTAERGAARERERLLAETEAARAAADLARRRLEALLEQLPIGVSMAEAPSGQLVLMNAAVRKLWGVAAPSAGIADYSVDYVGFRPPGTPRAGERYANEDWPLARALATGEAVPGEVIEVERPDGERVLLSVSAAPVHDADERVVGGVVTSVDVTERERLIASERAARAAADAANEAKSQFLANMSHELRTPLNAIQGYVQLLDMGIHGPVTAPQRDALGRVQGAQRRLLTLINDVLNYAKLESGSVEYELGAVALADVVQDVVPLVEPQVRAKGLAFDVVLPGAPCAVWADREKLGQVLLNLLSNAVKFTPRGGRITVDVSAGADGPPAGDGAERVFVRVRDTGRGIPADKLEAVFEPFVQVGKRHPGEAPGTGLGLAISRDLARGMGGDLTAGSTPGAGSVFTLTLPAA